MKQEISSCLQSSGLWWFSNQFYSASLAISKHHVQEIHGEVIQIMQQDTKCLHFRTYLKV